MIICKKCGSQVTWQKEGGKFGCFNFGTLVVHWDDCARVWWEQVKATGARFETEKSSGYADSVHGTQFDMIAAKEVQVGPGWKPDGCDCGLPPWELCRPDCQYAIKRVVAEEATDRFPFARAFPDA